ncbi:MAG: M28 family peptidase [Flavobacteriales bacterium]
MNKIKIFSICLVMCAGLFSCNKTIQQEKTGLFSITAAELKHHLDFLAADEFKGRDTPSAELKIASKYISNLSKKYGLLPVMSDNSYFQPIPLETSIVSEGETSIILKSKAGKEEFKFKMDFGVEDKNLSSGNIKGNMVFLGLGHQTLDKSWDDLKNINIEGKIVVILDANLLENHVLRSDGTGMHLRARAEKLVEMGAKAVVKIIDNERETFFQKSGFKFENSVKSIVIQQTGADFASAYNWDGSSWKKKEPVQKEPVQKEGSGSFNNIQIRHEMATAILGVSGKELNEMFVRVKRGEQISSRNLKGMILDIKIKVKKGVETTRNILALVEGTDPELKNEYVIVGAHYDHIGTTEGGVYNGANDNGSGTVGLIELAEAMANNRPARSVIIAWFTGEEKGLWGSEYFVSNPPVPLEKISAYINLDVISGDELNKITVTGSEVLSSELDNLINEISEDKLKGSLDYMKDTPSLSNFFFTRSDHFSFIMRGIPSVWFGAHSDHLDHIHQVSDVTETIYFDKIEHITKFSYLLALEVANYKTMLALDRTPEITKRGPHNLQYNWKEAIETKE